MDQNGHPRTRTKHRDDDARRSGLERVPWGILAFLYILLVLYGSLYPFKDWRTDGVVLLAFLTRPWPSHLSKPDVLTNLLAYIPLGLFLGCWLRRAAGVAVAVIVATLIGSGLSFAVEFLQQFLPSRDASAADLLFNAIGSLVGAISIVIVRPEGAIVQRTLRWRDEWTMVTQRPVNIGLLAIALWALSQLTPLVPSIDIGNLRHGLAPLRRFIEHPNSFNWSQWAAYALDIAGLALLAKTLMRPERHGFSLFFAFVAAVLLYKVPVVTRQLSAEAIFGACVALFLAAPFLFVRTRHRALGGILLIAGGFAVAELATDGTGPTHPFVWIPFSAQMENTLIGIASITENLWPAAALCYLAFVAAPQRHRGAWGWIGAAALGAFVFALEWRQQFLPGRIGDVTTVVLMVATWAFLWWRSTRAMATMPQPEPHRVPSHVGVRSRWITAAIAIAAVVVGGTGVIAGSRLVEVRVDESKLPQLGEPESLPPVNLPSFRRAHPRLPSPLPAEIEQLRAANPDFFRVLRQRAGGGQGEWDAVALQALVEPGSVDLNVLHRRLMALEFNWRGHEQGRALAQSYDWLYDKWTDAQRAQLRTKTIEGCNYLIRLIRHDRLSPYNVILYNAPMQALMACSIATFGDDPAADPVMRFTYDLWKNRVLPVWRQVMGKNGGWHEGGEYVGIGIGSAVYQLPAMWRKATGEDLFATEPGIRGFADFLVYRTRPDAMAYRWGDGSFFDRIVFEAPALAMEVGNAAAYRLRAPGAVIPSAWPWGPLTTPSFGANAQALPLTRYLDGIGMLVARSDWSPDATYVTFKAGDNFWSHTHLDQGAFTIYKGGALAIDSGLYIEYGSDHHLNYNYQTIAHNTITVTDPDDNVPMPGKQDKEPRPIANDGGQRRIGSGWGVEAAPLDLAEWESKRDIYHTGTMEKVLDQDGLMVGLADVTPAYTNSHSGEGTFSHRTRRVERFWRMFGYDRIDDAIVVFDQVEATRASFRKRWLLHTIDKPSVAGNRFLVDVLPREGVGHAGGRLQGTVLLPKEAQITPIGGPGLQFFVDDKNYDDDGKLEPVIATLPPNRGEPGAWRIEVMPPQDERADNFLVVMLPTVGASRATHKVQLLEEGNRVGCEIAGPKRTTRWWFTPGVDGVEIETIDAQGRHTYRLDGPSAHQVPSAGWWQRMRQFVGF